MSSTQTPINGRKIEVFIGDFIRLVLIPDKNWWKFAVLGIGIYRYIFQGPACDTTRGQCFLVMYFFPPAISY